MQAKPTQIRYFAEQYSAKNGGGQLMEDGTVRVSLLAEQNGVRWRVAEMLRPADAEQIAATMNAAQPLTA